jgi:hypothetical protein
VISSSSVVTLDTAVTYYFSFVVANPIPKGGFIIVYFPLGITINPAVASANCALMLNSLSQAVTPCIANSLTSKYSINFTNPFPSSGAGINTNVTLVIGKSATNPISTAPVSSFEL